MAKNKSSKKKYVEKNVKGLGTLRVFFPKKSKKLLAYASLNVDDKLYINGIRLVEFKKDGKYKSFLSLPSYLNDDEEYKPYVLFDKETRKLVEKTLQKVCDDYYDNGKHLEDDEDDDKDEDDKDEDDEDDSDDWEPF